MYIVNINVVYDSKSEQEWISRELHVHSILL